MIRITQWIVGATVLGSILFVPVTSYAQSVPSNVPTSTPIVNSIMGEIHTTKSHWNNLPKGIQQALIQFQDKNHNITHFNLVTQYFTPKGKPLTQTTGFVSDPKQYDGDLWVGISLYADTVDGDFPWTGTTNDIFDSTLLIHGQIFRPNGTVAYNNQKSKEVTPFNKASITINAENLVLGCGGYVTQDGYAAITHDLLNDEFTVQDSHSYEVICEG